LSVEQKLKIVKDILGPFYTSGSERLFTCPKCNHHKPKLSVNIEKDSFKCWICDFKAPAIYRLIRRYGNYQQRATWEELTGKFDLSNAPADLAKIIRDIDKKQEKEEEQVIKLPNEFRTLTGSKHHFSAHKAKKYLLSRGISKEDILKWKIGYCSTGDYEDRVIVPSFNMDGKVNYFIARSYGDTWMKYKNPPAQKDVLFNELYVDWDSDVVLVEGVFDAIVAGNAIPLLGSTLREDSVLFSKIVQNVTPLFVALDPDAEVKAMKLIKKLKQYGCEVFKIDVSGYADVGSMPRRKFERRKEMAVEMDLDESFLVHALNAV